MIVSAGLSQQGYMSLKEAAAWSSVSPKIMKRWFTRGLPRYQSGRGKILIRANDIDAFLTRHQEDTHNKLDALVDETLQEMGLGTRGGRRAFK